MKDFTFLFNCNTGKLSGYKNDIESVYFASGNYFGFYCRSGLRAITTRLYNELLTTYKI